ncbi:MAG: hypothetical protein U0746_04705 [Gemmataceae bacterium]
MPLTVVCPHCAAALELEHPPATPTPMTCRSCGQSFDRNSPAVEVRFPAFSTPPLLATPPPPPPPTFTTPPLSTSARPSAEGDDQFDGLPTPVVLPRNLAARFQPQPFETALGAILVLGLLVGVALGGVALWRRWTGGPRPIPVADGATDDAEFAAPMGPPRSEVPGELVGVWDARTGATASATLDLRDDGSAAYSGADGGSVATPVRGYWIARTQRERDYVIDFVPTGGSMKSYRLNLTLASPEMLTMTRRVVGGVANHDELRFVRRSPAGRLP